MGNQKVTSAELSPAPAGGDEDWLESIIRFWANVDAGDTGAASWEALVPLRDQVTEALGESPPNAWRAASLTAQAMSMMHGNTDH